MSSVPVYQLVLFGVLSLVGGLLSLGLVPRNRFFGLVTPRTLATDAAWYRANRAIGLVTSALVAAGVLLKMFPPQPLAHAILGLSCLIAAAGAYAIAYRRYAA